MPHARNVSGNIAGPRVILSPESARLLFDALKARTGWSWKEVAAHLGVHENVVRQRWAKARTTIPEVVFKTICAIIGDCPDLDWQVVSEHWGQEQQKVRIWQESWIERTAEFAEFMGIMLGDGCLYSNGSAIAISFNHALDQCFCRDRVNGLIVFLFGQSGREYVQDNHLRFVVYSRELNDKLYDFGFPRGKKIESSLTIPPCFFRHPLLLKACLRGLLDSDGGVFAHPNSQIMIGISSAITSLLTSICMACEVLGIEYGVTKQDVQFYGENALRFMSEVGTSNPRNAVRYAHYLRTGRVPSVDELPKLLKEVAVPMPYHGPVV